MFCDAKKALITANTSRNFSRSLSLTRWTPSPILKNRDKIESWWMNLLPVRISVQWTYCETQRADSTCSQIHKDRFLVVMRSWLCPSGARRSLVHWWFPFCFVFECFQDFYLWRFECRRPCRAEHLVSSSWISPALIFSFSWSLCRLIWSPITATISVSRPVLSSPLGYNERKV